MFCSPRALHSRELLNAPFMVFYCDHVYIYVAVTNTYLLDIRFICKLFKYLKFAEVNTCSIYI